MRKLVAGFVFLAALGASPAFAEKGFSAGASLGYSNVSEEDEGISVDFTGVGYKVFGAYMFGDHFGVEGGYLNFGKPSEDVYGTEIELDIDGFDLFVVGAVPLSDTFEFFGKAGMISWDGTISAEGFEDESDSGEDLALGIGGRFKGSSGFGLRAEYEWFDVAEADSAWMLSVGFEYAFK